MQQRSTHLFTIGLVHQENLAPYLNAGGLPLRPSPPGETSQRLVVISNPVHCFLQAGTEEVAGVLTSLWFYTFPLRCLHSSAGGGAAPVREVSHRAANVTRLDKVLCSLL